MTDKRPRHDDTSPFASLTHELVHGSGPQSHDFQMRDRDVTLVVEGRAMSSLHLLHLQNVRTDTLASAKAAVDDFLGQLEPTDPKKVDNTVFQNFDKVRQRLRSYVRAAKVEVRELYDELEWSESSPKKSAHTAPENPNHEQPDNPVVVVRAACETFLEQLKLLDDSDEPTKRAAHNNHEAFDEAHLEISEYMEERAEELGLIFEWNGRTFPRDTLRRSGSKILYVVYFSDDGGWNYRSGTC